MGKYFSIRFIINIESSITLVICSGNWTDDVLCLITLLMASGACTRVQFDFHSLQTEDLNSLCSQWISNAIDKEIYFYDLSGLEFPINDTIRKKNIDKSWIQSFEVDSLAHANSLCKRERYKRIAESKKWETRESSKSSTQYQDAQPDPVLGQSSKESEKLLKRYDTENIEERYEAL